MNWIHSRTWAEQKESNCLQTTLSCFFQYVWILEWLFFGSMKLFIHVIFFSFLCKYTYLFLMWSEHLDCKCVYRMFGRNVFQIGMYLSVELWVEAIFYIHRMLYYHVYLFVCFLLCYWFFVGTTHSFLHIFYSVFFIFQLKANSSCSNTQKAVSNLQMSNSKACHRRFNAKSNVHSMNNIRAPETFWSVFVTESVLALSECAAARNPERLTAVETDLLE